MRRIKRSITGWLIVLVGVAAPTSAQVADPPRAQSMPERPPTVEVYRFSADRVREHFLLLLNVPPLLAERVQSLNAESAVQTPSAHKRRTSVLTGLAIGAGAGAFAGWIFWNMVHDCGKCGPGPAGPIAQFTAVGGAIGAAIGLR